jgi:hypothetical protein
MSFPRRSARCHVLVDFLVFSFPFSFFPYLAIVSSIPPRVRQQLPSSLRHKTTYASQSHSFPLSLPCPFTFSILLHLSSISRSRTTPSCYHAATVRSPYYLFLVFSLCTYTFSVHFLSLTPPSSLLLYKNYTQPKGSARRAMRACI